MKIVVDSSALIAIVQDEAEREVFIAAIDNAEEVICSTVTLFETGVVLMRKKAEITHGHATMLADRLGLQIIPFTEMQCFLRWKRIAVTARGVANALI